MTKEHFDINQVEVTGAIKKLWSHGDLDIWIRLEIPSGEHTRRITLRIPDGTIDGKMVPLQKGELITAGGILVNSPWEEPLAKFLGSAGLPEERIAELDVNGQAIKRMGTRVDVLELEKREKLPEVPHNHVHLQGLVINTWTYSAKNYARLAIYDEHTTILKAAQPLPKREAHYVSVQTNPALTERHKVRGQGQIIVRLYRETVREVARKLRLELDLSPEEQEAYAIKPSVYAKLEPVVIFG